MPFHIIYERMFFDLSLSVKRDENTINGNVQPCFYPTRFKEVFSDSIRSVQYAKLYQQQNIMNFSTPITTINHWRDEK